jgi:hypothetical protein
MKYFLTAEYKQKAIFRLLDKIKLNEKGCWLFQANGNNSGYCTFWVNGFHHMAHRASWIIFNGNIPTGYCICHSCDTPKCVNPDHLWLGTHRTNALDAERKGRLKHPGQSYKTHCKRGHKFTIANTYKTIVGRSCRKCHAMHERSRRKALCAIS